MNVPVTMTTPQKEELPSCFAKEWDKNAPECAGGPDPNYVHPITQLHVHEQCSVFSSCGARQQAIRQSQLIPQQQLIRPPSVPWQQPAPMPAPAQAPQPANSFAEFLARQRAQQVEAQRQQAMSAPRPMTAAPQPTQAMPAPVIQPTYAHYPAPVYQLNYQMPGYLSTPEERADGEGLWPVLLREVIRSLFKASGHAVAHFFDVRTMKGK
jgi:hypothetical protein